MSAPAPRAPRRILCFGDSNTWGARPDGGGRHDAATRWTGVLSHRLGPAYAVIEEGLRGRTTRLDDDMGPGRNGAEYFAPCLMTHQPLDLIILMLGVNDLKDRFGQTAADVADGIDHLITLVDTLPIEGPSDQVPHVLIVAPPRLGARGSAFAAVYAHADTKSAELAPALAALAAARGLPFLDASAIVTVAGGDGVHFGAAGHKALGEALAQVVARLPLS